MKKELLEAISQYVNDYRDTPLTSDFLKLMDDVMDTLNKMESFADNITNINKKNVMKRNITMAQSLLIDNMEMYNEWLEKQDKND